MAALHPHSSLLAELQPPSIVHFQSTARENRARHEDPVDVRSWDMDMKYEAPGRSPLTSLEIGSLDQGAALLTNLDLAVKRLKEATSSLLAVVGASLRTLAVRFMYRFDLPLMVIAVRCPNLEMLAIRSRWSGVDLFVARRFVSCTELLPRLQYLALDMFYPVQAMLLEVMTKSPQRALDELRVCSNFGHRDRFELCEQLLQTNKQVERVHLYSCCGHSPHDLVSRYDGEALMKNERCIRGRVAFLNTMSAKIAAAEATSTADV